MSVFLFKSLIVIMDKRTQKETYSSSNMWTNLQNRSMAVRTYGDVSERISYRYIEGIRPVRTGYIQ